MFAWNTLMWFEFAKIIFGAAAAIIGIVVFSKGLKEKKREYRWNQAKEAKKILDGFRSEKLFKDTMSMLDWPNGRKYEISDNEFQVINIHKVNDSLIDEDEAKLPFDDIAVHIRCCFDFLFDSVQDLENAIKADLIQFSDVEYYFKHYYDRLQESKINYVKYLMRYRYHLACDFFKRFETKAAGE